MVLGGVASAVAIWAALVGVWRFGRAWLQRRSLRESIRQAQSAAASLRSTVIQIDHSMSEGVGWAGWAIWPERLESHIRSLDELILDAEGAAARVRGVDVEARLERLRADVEDCWLLVVRASEIYRSGVVSNYRAVEGKPIPPGATGRDVTAALEVGDENSLRELSRDFTHLVRSSLYQLSDDEGARSFLVSWPITRADIFAGDPEWEIPQFPEDTELAPPFGAW